VEEAARGKLASMVKLGRIYRKIENRNWFSNFLDFGKKIEKFYKEI
jgi:hypothetical protein